MAAVDQATTDYVAELNQNRAMVGREPLLTPEPGEESIAYLARLWFNGGDGHDYAPEFAARLSVPLETFTAVMNEINIATDNNPSGVIGAISSIGNFVADNPAVLLLAPIAVAGVLGAVAIGLPSIGELAHDFGGLLGGSIGDHTDDAGGALRALQLDVSSSLVADANESNRLLRSVGDVLKRVLEDRIRESTGALDQNTTRVFDVLRGVIQHSGDTNDALVTRVLGSIDEVINGTFTKQSDILASLGNAFELHLKRASDANEETASAIRRGIDEQIAQSQRNADAASGDLTKAIEAVTAASDSALATTRNALEKTGADQSAATREGSHEVATATAGGFQDVHEVLNRMANGAIDDKEFKAVGDVRGRIIDMMRLAGCPDDLMNIIEQFMNVLFGTFTVDRLKAEVGMLLSVQQSMIEPVLAVLGNCAAQAAATLVPTSLPGAPELREQLNRSLIDDQEARRSLMAQGYTLERAENLLRLRRNTPEVGIIQTWFLRGFIDENRTIRMLADLGYDTESIDHLIRMVYYVPPVGDLVTMAVREVWSPEIANKFGQFEDFPAAFAKYAGLQGVSEETAKWYWAAHWSLPSATQGFEMFHREIISRDDLNKLLRALDVMPYWRDKLTQMAYRPMPRVDIRRLHAVGIVTDQELPKLYQHFGFSPEDSAKMAEFTKRLNHPAASENVNELRGITRAGALSLFRIGAIDEAQTRDILGKAKVSQGAQNILIQHEKTALEIKDREERTNLIIDQAKAGTISFNDAHGQLSALGLTATELKHAMVKLDRARATATKLPSHPDLDKLLKQKLVTTAEYLTTMQLIGYSEVWSQRFLQLAQHAK